MNKVYAYLRTSKDVQEYGIAAQRIAVEAEADRQHWDAVRYVEEHASGRDMTARRRPKFYALLEQLQTGDVLVVAKVDRVSRSVRDFANLLVRSKEEGWRLVVLGLVDTDTSQGKFTAHVMAAVAELERDLISDRTREGLAVARANGKQIGTPKVTVVDDRLLAVMAELRNGHRVPFAEVAARLNARGLLARYPNGDTRPWRWNTVRAVMVRHGLHQPELVPQRRRKT